MYKNIDKFIIDINNLRKKEKKPLTEKEVFEIKQIKNKNKRKKVKRKS